MINVTGYPTKEQVLDKFPDQKVLVKPKAIIECYQEIPCNPCETSCPVGAITIGDNINKTPTIDYTKCIGCSKCVYSCPGLCIMVVKVSEDSSFHTIPYELLPLPKVGDIWNGVNRKGEIICKAKIERVFKNKETDRTAVITASVPKKYIYDFITVRCPNE